MREDFLILACDRVLDVGELLFDEASRGLEGIRTRVLGESESGCEGGKALIANKGLSYLIDLPSWSLIWKRSDLFKNRIMAV